MITDEEQKRILADNLRRYIEQSGKSQRSVADDLGVNRPTFNQWVRGKALPSVSMVQNIADYFHVALSDLAYEPATSRRRDDLINTVAPYLNNETLEVIIAYSQAERWKRQSIKKLLDIPEKREPSSISQAV